MYVPTTVNAVIKNIDAVDVAATSVSCTNLTVNGEPVSNVLTNIGSTSVGNTVFTGTVTATNLAATSALTAAGDITQSAGSTTLKATTVDSLTTAGNLDIAGYVQCNTFQPRTGTTFTLNAYTASGSPFKFFAPTLTGTVKAVLGKADSSANSLELGFDIGSGTTSTCAGSLGINGATPMLYFKNQQLGINTTAPSSTLTVAGTVTCTNVIQSSPSVATYTPSTTTQSISNNTNTTVLFGQASFSTGNISTWFTYNSTTGVFTNASGSTRTVQVAYSVLWTGNTTNVRFAYINANASCVPSGTLAYNAAQGSQSFTGQTGSCIFQMSNNATFQITAYQNSGGALDINKSGTFLSLHVLG